MFFKGMRALPSLPTNPIQLKSHPFSAAQFCIRNGSHQLLISSATYATLHNNDKENSTQHYQEIGQRAQTGASHKGNESQSSPRLTDDSLTKVATEPRLPRSVQAVYLKPLKRHSTYGVPTCDLQLRSYSPRNVAFFSDFALRAAYYLKLPASGPIPLPRIVERWTVSRSNFVHKKSQENFERITLRRLIQIQDGNPETVELWLAFLRKHAYHGVGMKANLWEYEEVGVGKTMDVSLKNLRRTLDPQWAHFGRKKNVDTSEQVMEMMRSAKFRHIDNNPTIPIGHL